MSQTDGKLTRRAGAWSRTATARCGSACTVLTISESTFTQLYYQNPEFGFLMISLVAGRLSADVKRLENKLAELQSTNGAAFNAASIAASRSVAGRRLSASTAASAVGSARSR